MLQPRPSTIGAGDRKPPARATRVQLVEREVREHLGTVAVERLLRAARVLSEGSRARALPRPDGTRGPDPYFGSTMLTIDLAELAAEVREPVDGALAERVAALVALDARVTRHARRIAEDEASRLAGERLETTTLEVRVRARGTALHIDVDVEGLAPPRAREVG